MKILLVNDYGTEVGGVETYIESLKSSLIEKGHDVRIFSSTSKQHTATFSDYTFPGINPKSPLRFIPYLFNIKALNYLKAVLREFNPDFVHLNYIFYHCSPSILLALKQYPTFYTIHAHELIAPVGVKRKRSCRHGEIGYCWHCQSLFRFLIEKSKRILFKIFSSSINLYIAPSSYYQKIHVDAGYKKIVIVPNGIRLLQPAPLNFNKNLIFVGRLEYDKGVHVLIRSIAIIKKNVSDIHLTIIGSGSKNRELYEIVEDLSLKNHVEIIGHIDHKNIGQYYNKCDVLILPSISNESFGLVGIEAMSVGRPVVGTNMGGIPDWLSNGVNGLLVPPNNPKAIATAVTKILSDKVLLKKMSLHSRQTSEKYDIENHVTQLIELIMDCTDLNNIT